MAEVIHTYTYNTHMENNSQEQQIDQRIESGLKQCTGSNCDENPKKMTVAQAVNPSTDVPSEVRIILTSIIFSRVDVSWKTQLILLLRQFELTFQP